MVTSLRKEGGGGQEEGKERPKTRYNLPRAWLHGLTVFN
jgi:hypothetical protein